MKLLVKKTYLLLYLLVIINAVIWLVISIELTSKNINAAIVLSWGSAFLLGGCYVWFNSLVKETIES